MPTLKDYLGSLIKDLNYARVIADVESANIAKMYAEHDLLKHFSIPRMKIQDTELTIPIAIDELEKSVETDYQPIDNNRFYTRTYAEIKNVFKVTSFKRDISTSLRKEIFAKIDSLEKAVKSGADIRSSLADFSDSVSDISIKMIKSDQQERSTFEKAMKFHDMSDEQFREKLVGNLAKYLHPEIKPREVTSSIENALVTVESDKLKEKKPDTLLYIKLKITEESMEWQTIEDAEGNIISKLMVE